MKPKKLSVVLATYNEENNIRRCLESVSGIADEIVVVDGGSRDNTVKIAEDYNARIIRTDNPAIFHINKQKALNAATFDWILQMDADEEVTPELAEEISRVIRYTDRQIRDRVFDPQKRALFDRHQKLIEHRDGIVGSREGEVAAFYIARRNYFLGGTIRYAGTYPDGVIRLVKKGRASFPCKSVHEQITIDGRVDWLQHDLIHYSNPTLKRYMSGAQKYTDLLAAEIRKDHSSIVMKAGTYIVVKPLVTFMSLYILHKGMLDGWRGLLFSLFSSLHFPVAFIKSI